MRISSSASLPITAILNRMKSKPASLSYCNRFVSSSLGWFIRSKILPCRHYWDYQRSWSSVPATRFYSLSALALRRSSFGHLMTPLREDFQTLKHLLDELSQEDQVAFSYHSCSNEFVLIFLASKYILRTLPRRILDCRL